MVSLFRSDLFTEDAPKLCTIRTHAMGGTRTASALRPRRPVAASRPSSRCPQVLERGLFARGEGAEYEMPRFLRPAQRYASFPGLGARPEPMGSTLPIHVFHGLERLSEDEVEHGGIDRLLEPA